jgi:glycosyl-4,4'-diaponeurosporenoate acyltransferase
MARPIVQSIANTDQEKEGVRMRLIILPTGWTLLIDIVAWFFFHVLTALVALKIPNRHFAKEHGFYRTRSWERDGRFWQDAFGVRRWKKQLPDGASIMGRGFVKKRMLSQEADWLGKYIMESRRAELTHILAMIPALFFFLWNPWPAGLLMILYAILVNMPCLIAQRYNRPRFQRVLQHKIKPSEANEGA